MPSIDQRPRVLILTYAPVASGPRPLKQIRALEGRYRITTAGVGPAPAGVDDHIELRQGEGPGPLGKALFALVLLLRLHRLAFTFSGRNRDGWRKLRDREWDLILNHDVATMSLALRLTSRHGVVTDLHEYAPRQNEEDWKWRATVGPYFDWLCRCEVPRARALTTVGDGIAKEYSRVYGLTAQVAVNATPYHELVPGPVSAPLRLVHSGAPLPSRSIHTMIEAVRDSDADVTLDLYLVQNGSAYRQRLVELAASTPKVRVLDPVPYETLVTTLNGYDVGLAVIAPANFNQAWCLPNKFFDFIQARLGVIVGPSPEMESFVSRYEVGAVAEGFDSSSVAAALSTLTRDGVERWKENSHAHAEALSGGRQAAVWAGIVDEIFRSPAAP